VKSELSQDHPLAHNEQNVSAQRYLKGFTLTNLFFFFCVHVKKFDQLEDKQQMAVLDAVQGQHAAFKLKHEYDVSQRV
jgi:hypothetical protein